MLKLPKLVILDRDGVINHDSPDYIKSPDEWRPIEGSLEAIARLNQANIKVGIATNQRGIAIGRLTEKNFLDIQYKMERLLHTMNAHIDFIEYCTAENNDHPDRKPNPGMLTRIIQNADLSINPDQAYFVGDKISDIKAALNARCIPILVKTGYGAKTVEKLKINSELSDILIFDDLNSFVSHLLSEA